MIRHGFKLQVPHWHEGNSHPIGTASARVPKPSTTRPLNWNGRAAKTSQLVLGPVWLGRHQVRRRAVGRGRGEWGERGSTSKLDLRAHRMRNCLTQGCNSPDAVLKLPLPITAKHLPHFHQHRVLKSALRRIFARSFQHFVERLVHPVTVRTRVAEKNLSV